MSLSITQRKRALQKQSIQQKRNEVRPTFLQESVAFLLDLIINLVYNVLIAF